MKKGAKRRKEHTNPITPYFRSIAIFSAFVLVIATNQGPAASIIALSFLLITSVTFIIWIYYAQKIGRVCTFDGVTYKISYVSKKKNKVAFYTLISMYYLFAIMAAMFVSYGLFSDWLGFGI
jgi:hypothetical protein